VDATRTLPLDSLVGGIRQQRFVNPALYVRSLQLLQHCAATAAAAGAPPDAGTVRAAAAQSVRYDVSPASCALLSPSEIEGALTRERMLVEVTLTQLEVDAVQSRTYAPLLRPTDMRPSTANSVGTLDFIDAPLLRSRAATTNERVAWIDRLAEEQRAVNRHLGIADAATEKLVAAAIASVDDIDNDFLARDDFLKLRIEHQAANSGYRSRNALAIDALRREVAAGVLSHEEGEARMAAVLRDYRVGYWSMLLEQARRTFEAFMHSTNIPDVLQNSPFRPWLLANANAEALVETLDHRGERPPVQYIPDMRPFGQAFQQLHTVLRDCLHTSSQSYPAALLGFVCSLDAHYYDPRRSAPATNLLLVGDTGIGSTRAHVVVMCVFIIINMRL
jgi:hypothetical protein